jgi:hypothetical protein
MVETTRVTLDVSYSQIAVFGTRVEAPFSDWTDRHVEQGFAWRQESASFRTVEEAGPHEVVVVVGDHLGPVSADAVRVIDVPFDVPEDGALEIASIADSVRIAVPGGRYLLRCEFLPLQEDVAPVRLSFASGHAPVFRVVVADAELAPDGDLLTSADPAGS